MRKKFKINRSVHVDIKNVFDWALDEKYLNFKRFKKENFNKKYIKCFNEKKTIKNYEFSKKFTDKIFNKFSKQLNKYHNSDFSSNYWKIITYTWLFVVVNLIYEYWNLFNILKRRNFLYNIYKVDDKLMEYEDTFDFNRQSEHFHLWVLSELIRYKKSLKYFEKKYSKTQRENKVRNFSLVKSLFRYISKFALFFNSYKVFIKDLDLKKKDILYLNFKLKQLPVIWYSPNFKQEEINIKKRKNIFYKESAVKNFTGFFYSIIYKIIPKSFLENFANINLTLEKSWPKNVNQILTKSIHHDDIFKIWIAKMRLKKAKLYIFQHGGYFGMSKFHHGEYLESLLSDKFFTWGWKNRNKKIFPFFSLLLNTCKLKKTNLSFNERENIIFCITSNTKYLSLPGFFARNNLMRIEKLFLIQNSLKRLKNEIKKKITIRYSNQQFYRNKLIFNEKFFGKNLKFDNGSKRLISHLHNSKLVIHDNYSTGWLETLFYGIPTVIIIDKNIEKFRKSFNKNLNDLKKNKIIHLTSSSLANFLNKNHNKIESWWYSKQVQRSVQLLKSEYIKKSSDPLNDLVKKLRKLN